MDAVQDAEQMALGDRVRRVHSSFPTGVAVVTTAVDGAPFGLAVNAFTSVSLEPPVIMFCVAKKSQTHVHLDGAEHAAVNLLSHRQLEVARRFAKSGGDKFGSLEWHVGENGSPLLDGTSAWLEVALSAKDDAGTHTIFTGAVRDAGSNDLPPLVYLAPGLFDGSRLVEATG
jgi:flavin reductase (DIM6/NTAB) family NADH-FMN oxidoreductase RutF